MMCVCCVLEFGLVLATVWLLLNMYLNKINVLHVNSRDCETEEISVFLFTGLLLNN